MWFYGSLAFNLGLNVDLPIGSSRVLINYNKTVKVQ